MAVDEVVGWVWSVNARRALEWVSVWVGYTFEDSDWLAIETALPDTDGDVQPERWYDYPIIGSPPLTAFLAEDHGAAVVNIRIRGELDPVLAARIDTTLSILADVIPAQGN